MGMCTWACAHGHVHMGTCMPRMAKVAAAKQMSITTLASFGRALAIVRICSCAYVHMYTCPCRCTHQLRADHSERRARRQSVSGHGACTWGMHMHACTCMHAHGACTWGMYMGHAHGHTWAEKVRMAMGHAHGACTWGMHMGHAHVHTCAHMGTHGHLLADARHEVGGAQWA